MIKFTKMQGLGNDFICTEFENTKQYNLKIFSKAVHYHKCTALIKF